MVMLKQPTLNQFNSRSMTSDIYFSMGSNLKVLVHNDIDNNTRGSQVRALKLDRPKNVAFNVQMIPCMGYCGIKQYVTDKLNIGRMNNIVFATPESFKLDFHLPRH